ncbi:hypothetical protein PSPO01_14832 [Paraphaeosphaeria sporulosa]
MATIGLGQRRFWALGLSNATGVATRFYPRTSQIYNKGFKLCPTFEAVHDEEHGYQDYQIRRCDWDPLIETWRSLRMSHLEDGAVEALNHPRVAYEEAETEFLSTRCDPDSSKFSLLREKSSLAKLDLDRARDHALEHLIRPPGTVGGYPDNTFRDAVPWAFLETVDLSGFEVGRGASSGLYEATDGKWRASHMSSRP